MTYCVYALVDPTTSLPRYIGCSSRPKQRFATHLGPKATAAIREWVAGIGPKRKPKLRILQRLKSRDDALYWESAYILYYSGQAPPLLNTVKPAAARTVLDMSLVVQVANEALVDRRTVRKYLARVPLRPLTAARIEQAIRGLGLDPETLQVEYEGSDDS